MTRIVPLGTNGYFPTHGRQTMCFLVLKPEQALLLDAGTGMARLAEPALKDLLVPYENLDIVLSHYHLDHVVGLSYLPETWTRGRIRVYGPAGPLVEAEPASALSQLLSQPLFSARYDSFPAPVEVIPFREPGFDAGGTPIRVWRQNHPGGSAGLRIGDEIAYLTDTAADPENADRVRGVKLLLHELWLTDEEAAEEGISGHSDFSAVAGFVRAAAPLYVMLVHHHPSRPPEAVRDLTLRLETETGLRALVAEEGRPYLVG